MKVFRAISATTAADVVGRCRSLSSSFFHTHSLFLSLFLCLANIVYRDCGCIYRCIPAFAGLVYSVGTSCSIFVPFRFSYTPPKNFLVSAMLFQGRPKLLSLSLAIQVYLIKVCSRYFNLSQARAFLISQPPSSFPSYLKSVPL